MSHSSMLLWNRLASHHFAVVCKTRLTFRVIVFKFLYEFSFFFVSDQPLLIMDARSYTATVANRAFGGGVESTGIPFARAAV